jgi:hypothetical protein
VGHQFGLLQRALDCRHGGFDIHHVGTQPHRRKLKRRPCPRTRLDEKVDERSSAQSGHLFEAAFADAFECFGGVEDDGDFTGGEIAEGDEILAKDALDDVLSEDLLGDLDARLLRGFRSPSSARRSLRATPRASPSRPC